MIGRMILNPATSQKEPETTDANEFVRMINDARANGMSQASGAGFASVKLDIDDASNPDQAILDNPQIGGIDMLAAAASFGAVVPGAVQAAYANHLRAVELRGIGSLTNGGGSLENEFRAMFDEVDENGKKKDEDEWEAYAEAHEQMSEQRRRLEEAWDRNTHSIAGMQMTGAEIDSLVEFMNDPAMRQKLIERRAREKGISVEQAEKDIDAVQRYLELTKKEKIEGLTQQEKQELTAYKADPKMNEAVRSTQIAHLEESGKPEEAAKISQMGTQEQAVASRSDALDTGNFPTAPSVQAAFTAAKAAKEPLDAEKPVTNNPVLIAANTAPPPQVAASGFDV